ncbi:MAG: alanine racemase [Hespellia sp.]|nr:alanine racemase [Hespellia sp.]
MEQNIICKVSEMEATPAYVFDIDALNSRISHMKEVLGNRVTLCYAMKANPFLVKAMSSKIDKYEVCSPGEMRICERDGIPMKQIVFSGVNKEIDDIDRVIKTYEGQGIFTVESLSQLALLETCAKVRDKKLSVLLRLSSGNQFGMDWETIKGIIEQREKYPHQNMLGLQLYSGTQKKKLTAIKKELDMLDERIIELLNACQFEVQILEYGPGLSVPYFQTDREEDDEQLNGLKELLDQMKYQGEVHLEMGRYIAAFCGCYITKIVDLKENFKEKYCIIDGGINHLNYYGQIMGMKVPRYRHLYDGERPDAEEKWNICGSLCTSADVLVKKLMLKKPELDDILVFENTGAYSVTEGIYLFLSRDLPTIFFYSEKEGLRMVRQRMETDSLNSEQL